MAAELTARRGAMFPNRLKSSSDLPPRAGTRTVVAAVCCPDGSFIQCQCLNKYQTVPTLDLYIFVNLGILRVGWMPHILRALGFRSNVHIFPFFFSARSLPGTILQLPVSRGP